MTSDEPDRQPLRIEHVQGTTVVHLVAREVQQSYPEYNDADVLKEKFKFLISQGHTDMVLDLASLEYAPSMFLGILMLTHRRLQAASGRLRLCGLQPLLQDVFRVSGLDRYFDIFPDVAAALAARRR